MRDLDFHAAKVNESNNFEIVIYFLENSDLIIDTAGYQSLWVAFHHNQRQDLRFVFGKMFHFCSIENVMDWDITFEVSDNHALLEAVKGHGSDFVLTDLDKDFSDIAIESTPDFDFVTRCSDKACSLLNVSYGDDKILVSSVRIVVFIVFVNWERFTDENQFQGLIDGNEPG